MGIVIFKMAMSPIENNQQNLDRKVWQDPFYFYAFGFGSGLMPVMPGTWGTLVALPIYLLINDLPLMLYLICTALAFLLGIWASHRVSQDLNVHDYSGIVCDEMVGYLLTMAMAPKGGGWMITGFLLFRVFDVWKPSLIGWMDEKISGGFGIMMDDVGAAIPAWLILQCLAWGLAS